MSSGRSVVLRGTGMVLVGLALAATAGAAELAPEGAGGVLEMEIQVEGKGRVTECGFCDHYDWSARNRASLRVALSAQQPTVDTTQLAGLAGPAGAAREGGDDDEEDWEAAWDERFDACDGDENCEMRVSLQKMQDPRFQASMGAMIQAIASLEVGGLDLEPAVQSWAMRGGDIAGTVEIDQQLDTFGAWDGGGGGAVDTHCRTHGRATLAAGPTGYGDAHPILTVNAQRSTYELVLPAEQVITVTDECDPDRPQTAALLGTPAAGSNWSEVLRVSGKLAGGPARPALEGTGVWEGDLAAGLGSPRLARVTIHWKFRPGA